MRVVYFVYITHNQEISRKNFHFFFTIIFILFCCYLIVCFDCRHEHRSTRCVSVQLIYALETGLLVTPSIEFLHLVKRVASMMHLIQQQVFQYVYPTTTHNSHVRALNDVIDRAQTSVEIRITQGLDLAVGSFIDRVRVLLSKQKRDDFLSEKANLNVTPTCMKVTKYL